MEGQILVTPKELTDTAEEFNQQGREVSQLTSEMMNIVTGLGRVWEGEASQAYIQKFKGLEDDIQKMIRMIDEHVKDLTDMAGIYESVEQENISDISNLSSDIIS